MHPTDPCKCTTTLGDLPAWSRRSARRGQAPPLATDSEPPGWSWWSTRRGQTPPLVAYVLSALAVLAAVVAGADGQAPREDDPLPLLRITLSPEQLTQELTRLKQGALVKLPREEFERRVRQAAAATAAAKVVARVVRAHYAAELSEEDLVQGHGEWAVDNPGPGAAPLPLTPLSLALSNSAWEDGTRAIVGDLEGKGLGAVVPAPGLTSLFFDWSCRGTVTPHGLTFDVRLPPAPQTTLDLTLPADSWPAIPAKAGLLTGPHDAGAAGKRLWKLQLAGKAQVALAIRKMPAGPPALFVQTQARQIVTPDRVAADYEFQVEVPRGAVRELVFEGDGTLEPFEVTARSADVDWRWDASAGTLVVEFREPQQGLIAGLRVRCLAPRPIAPAEWISPALRLRQAVCRSETLKLTVHPEIHLARWLAGDFHPVGSATETDGGLTLTLVNARAAVAAPSVRPRCQFVTGDAEFATVQETRWHIEPDATSLRSEITYVVSRGQLHQLAVKLPTVGGPYHVDAVDVEPKGLLRSWAPAGPQLLVDLQHGLTPRTEARLIVQLRSRLKPTGQPRVLDLPDLAPEGATVREGKLNVTLDPLFNAELLQSSVPPTQAIATGRDRPAFAFAYHDHFLTGKLRLFTQRPQIHVHAHQEVALGADAAPWQAKLDVEPLLGRPAFLDLYLSAPLHRPFQVTADGEPAIVQHTTRRAMQDALPQLLVLGAGSPREQAALGAALPRGEHWRVHFARPLTQKTTLHFRGSFRPSEPPARPDPGTTWEVPVLSLPGIEQQEGTLIVRPGNQRIERTRQYGMAASLSAGATVSFQLSPAASSCARLELHTRPGTAAPDQNAVCEVSELISCLETDGSLSHLLRVRLRNWRQPRFDVTIPGTARALAARIDGVWLDRLDVDGDADGTRFRVPVNTTTTLQQFELHYASDAASSAWGFLCLARAAEPRLAKEPLEQRRYWRLPAGWTPWAADRWQPRGEPEGVRMHQALSALPGRLWHAGETLLPWDSSSSAWSEVQRAELDKAETRVRSQLARGTTLGAAMDRLAQLVKDAMPLVIDVPGMRSASKQPGTIVPPGPADRPFWEALDLIYVPCPSGAVLTTPERLRQWQEGDATSLGALLDIGVAEAALHGLDHAGCFASVDHWLRTAPPPAPVGSSREPDRGSSLFADVPDSGWTEWEPVPGLPADATVWLVFAPTARGLGYVLAGLWLVLAAWAGRRLAPAACVRAHLVAATVIILAALWLPASVRAALAGPLVVAELAAFAVTFTIHAWPRGPASRPSKSTMVRPAAALMLLGAAGAAVPLTAQPPPAPEPQSVYLITGGEPGKESALVSPELVRKLDELASRPTALPAGAVVVAAQYQGQVKDGMAEIAARFDVHHFSDQSTFVLPLTGVQLQPGIFLDGAPVFPVAHKGGYALPLRGQGLHQLTLTFQARAVVVNEFHELRFGVPRAGQCQLELSWAAPTRGLHLVGGLGEVKIQLDKKGHATVTAHLGHEGLVQARWSATAGPPVPAAIEVREAYFWDLRPLTLGLTAGVQFSIAKGSLSQVRFALPEGLEVRQVEVAARPGAPAVLSAPALRHWDVIGKDSTRQLVVDFAQPVAGSVTLLIEMVPRLGLTPGQWLLRLPAPLQGTSTAGLLAYRLEGMDAVSSPQNLSVGTVITPELLAENWAELVLRKPAAPTKVVNFRRISPSAALSLTVQVTRPAAHANLRWQVTRRGAEVSAHVNVTGSAEDLVLVELELPPRLKLVKLAEANGVPIHHWSRQGNLVQVWLQQPRKQIELDVRGWVEHAKPGPAARFDVVPLGVRRVRSIAATIAIDPEAGLALVPERLQNLTRADKADGLRLVSNGGNYEASLALRAMVIPATGRAFTLVQRRHDVVEMTTALHLEAQPGDLRVVVSGWTGADLRLDTPVPVVRKSQQHQGGQHSWTLQLPPGLPQTITLTLRGRLAADQPANGWTLPFVKVSPYTLQDHWIGLSGVEPAARDSVDLGVPPAAAVPSDCPFPPREMSADARIGKLKAVAGGLTLRLLPATATDATHILAAEQDCFWAGAGWLHELRLLALAHGQGELRVRLPEGSRCLAVAVDDHVAVPAAGELLIPLPGPPGPHVVQVCWDYRDGEQADMPRLDRPLVTGVAAGDIHGRFWLPSAYQLARVPAGLSAGAVEAALRQANARMRLCQLWAETGPPVEDLRREQRAFHGYLDQANALIALLQRSGTVGGTAELTARARQLRDENAVLAKKGGYADAAGPARLAVGSHAVLPMGDNGLPLFMPTGALALASVLEDEQTIARATTELVLLTVVVLLLLSFLRRGVALLRALWPEALVALAAFGISVGGPSPVAIALLAVGLGLRALWLIMVIQRVLPAWFAGGAEPANGDAVSIPAPPH